MTDDTTDPDTPADEPLFKTLRSQAKTHAEATLQDPLAHVTAQAGFLWMLLGGQASLYVMPVVAANTSTIGSVFCSTPVADGIGLIFGAIAGLGLPATMFFMGRSGLSYMRSSGNPNKKNKARSDLILTATGFGIVALAIVAPELVDKVGSTIGFGFSSCVMPY
ncbi:hypothetical protein [Haloarcula halophila]|uniref:hypothetical protein n=1 Tax=Haloarcula TaxID=2237 RepID=UPI0023E3D86B|nr:hypothetical protein [Halomicroarcula sp. DFY41]